MARSGTTSSPHASIILSPLTRLVHKDGAPWIERRDTLRGIALTSETSEALAGFQVPVPLASVGSRGEAPRRMVEALTELGLLVAAPQLLRRARICLVTTVREPGASFRQFVAYHVAIGIEHVYAFIDSPDSQDWAAMQSLPQVTALRGSSPSDPPESDPRLALIRSEIRREVMARQILNVERALPLAREAGFDWLLHLDVDELFGCPDARAHFDAIPADVGVVHYLNLEGVPEVLDSSDVFRDTQLFKLNSRMLPDGVIDRWLSEHRRKWHFLAYANGKAAVRVAPGARSKGVHSFVPPDAHAEVLEFNLSPVVLHYAHGSLSQFMLKYRHRGSFSDYHFGRTASPRLEFHRLSRDVVASGDSSAIEAWYRQHVLFDRADDRNDLLEAGLARAVPTPSAILAGA